MNHSHHTLAVEKKCSNLYQSRFVYTGGSTKHYGTRDIDCCTVTVRSPIIGMLVNWDMFMFDTSQYWVLSGPNL